MGASMHAVLSGIETCFQRESQQLFVPKVLKTVFQDTCWTVFSNYICLICDICVSQWLRGSQRFTFEFVCMLVWERNCNLFSTSSIQTSSCLCLKGHLLNLVTSYIYVSWFVWNPKESPNETLNETLNDTLNETLKEPTWTFRNREKNPDKTPWNETLKKT